MSMNRNLRALVEQEVKGSGSGMTISSAAALAVRHANSAAFLNKKAASNALKVLNNLAKTKSEKDYSKVMMEIFDLLLELEKAAEATHLATSAAGSAINTASDAEAKSLEKEAQKQFDKVMDIADKLK